MTTTIYGLADKNNPLELRYIGKTINTVCRRLQNHISVARQNKYNNHKNNWIRSLSDTPIIYILDEVEDYLSSEVEIRWIKKAKDFGYNLVNGTLGGEGTLGRKHTKESLEKMHKPHKMSKEWLTKIKQSRIQNPPRKGKKAYEGYGDLISITKSGGKSYVFKSPEGIVFSNVCNVSRFAREIGLKREGFKDIASGKRKSYKGWILI